MTREEAIKTWLPIISMSIDNMPELKEAFDMAIKALEPKAGHWIDCDNSEDYSADGYDCSVCGVNAEYATSYCPNCGARMVEPQKSEDTE